MTDRWKTRETLLTRLREQRDDQSWAEFVSYYSAYIYSVACAMGLKHHDAEEIVQNVTLQAWKIFPEFEYDSGKGRFRGWLCTVTANETRSLMRKRKRGLSRMNPQEQDALRRYLQNLHIDNQPDLVEEEWQRYVSTLAWQQIQPHFKEATLQAFERASKGEPVSEIAAALAISESSVYVYRKRVADRLRQEIRKLNSLLD